MRRSTIQQNWGWGLLLAGAVTTAWAGKVSDMEFVETEATKAAEIEFKKWTLATIFVFKILGELFRK